MEAFGVLKLITTNATAQLLSHLILKTAKIKSDEMVKLNKIATDKPDSKMCVCNTIKRQILNRKVTTQVMLKPSGRYSHSKSKQTFRSFKI